MTEVSDLSEATLGADEPASVTVLFEDGRRARATITKDEARRLFDNGLDLSKRSDVWMARLRWALKKLGPWAAALAITVLVSNYVASWYSNRQQEIELDSDLSKAISTSAREAYNDAFAIVVEGAYGDPARMTFRSRNKVVKNWTEASAELDPLMYVHYDETSAEVHWQRFQDAVFRLIDMSYVDRPDARAGQVAVVRRYLDDYPRLPRPSSREEETAFRVLSCARPRCNENAAFVEWYRWVGHQLMRRRGEVARDILDADAKKLG